VARRRGRRVRSSGHWRVLRWRQPSPRKLRGWTRMQDRTRATLRDLVTALRASDQRSLRTERPPKPRPAPASWAWARPAPARRRSPRAGPDVPDPLRAGLCGCDGRYRDLDIRHREPTPAEQAAAPWHLIDIVDPSQEFSVAAFQARAAGYLPGSTRVGMPLLVRGHRSLHRAVVDGLEIPGRFPDESGRAREPCR